MFPPRESAVARGRKTAAIILASVVGLALFAAILYAALHPSAHRGIPKIIVGTSDEVYYSHAATEEDARSLGRALQAIGFFNNRGTAVLLSKGTSGTIVSFVLNDGAWNHPPTVASFEEIGRRIAAAVGGYPIQVRLGDLKWGVHKELVIGKVMVGARDEVYYFGSATKAEAESLGHALQSNGFLVDSGATVELSKDSTTAISFVLGDGAWQRSGALAGFEALVRKVAASVGGQPVDLRLLNPRMEIEREITGLR